VFLISLSIFFKLIFIVGLLAQFISENIFLFLLNPLTAIAISYFINKKYRKPLVAVSFFVLDCFLPIFGFVSMCIFIALGPLYRKIYQDSKIDVYDIPMGEETFNEYAFQKRILIQGENEEAVDDELYENFQIQPYLDVFNEEDLDLKLNAIEKLSRSLTSESVEILKKALDDPSYEVRYFANSALEKIEKKMFSKIDVASENIKRFPDEHHNYNNRGQLYLDSYFLGFLDSSIKEFFLEKSLYDFIFSLQLKPGQSKLYLKITQIYLQQKDFEKVLEIADQALENELSMEDRAKIRFYRAEANYNLKEFQKISEDCDSVNEVGILYSKVRESSDWWAESGIKESK
tara:strand:- start:8672 stop:9709 length:1038 start_codon:yes stop_codon:yes gene_type:complete